MGPFQSISQSTDSKVTPPISMQFSMRFVLPAPTCKVQFHKMPINQDTAALREMGIVINSVHHLALCTHHSGDGGGLGGRIVPTGVRWDGSGNEIDCVEGIMNHFLMEHASMTHGKTIEWWINTFAAFTPLNTYHAFQHYWSNEG
jgi:hypothetical protein